MYPRRAHWPIVVPDTPTSSPASPARKRPWGRLGAMARRVLPGRREGKGRAASAGFAQQAGPVGLGDRRRLGIAQEAFEHREEPDRVLAVREVAGPLEDLEAASGDRVLGGAAVRDRDDRVALAPDDQRREMGGEVEAIGRGHTLSAGVDRRAGGVYEGAARVGVAERRDPGRDAREILARLQPDARQRARDRA